MQTHNPPYRVLVEEHAYVASFNPREDPIDERDGGKVILSNPREFWFASSITIHPQLQ